MPMSLQSTPTSYHRSENGYVPRGPERWKRARMSLAKNPKTAGAKLLTRRADATHWVLDQFQTVCGDTWRDEHHVFAHQRMTWSDGQSWSMKTKYYTCSVECAGYQLQLDGGASINADEIELLRLILAALQGEGVTGGHFGYNVYSKSFTQLLIFQQPDRNVRCYVCGDQIGGALYGELGFGQYTPGEYAALWAIVEEFGARREEWTETKDRLDQLEPLTGVVPPPVAPEPEPAEKRTVLVIDAAGVVHYAEQLTVVSVTDRELDLIVDAAPHTAKAFGAKYGKELAV